jgi:hypothetical protein
MQIDTRIVAPSTKLLRGRTRYLGAIDEIGWFEERVHDSVYSGEIGRVEEFRIVVCSKVGPARAPLVVRSVAEMQRAFQSQSTYMLHSDHSVAFRDAMIHLRGDRV